MARGNTKRHFPVKITAKGKQLGVESHTYNAFQTYTHYARYV